MAGRPSGKTCIVDDIYSDDYIRTETLRLRDIIKTTEIPFSALEWLAKRGLILNSMNCEECNQPCTLNKHAARKDGWIWRCYPHSCNRSVRTNSIFWNSNLSLNQIIEFLFMWCSEYPQRIIIYELLINTSTAVNWSNYLRIETKKFLERHPQEIGGVDESGTPIEVEIGVSNFFRRKGQRDPLRQEHWVFGGLERGSGKCFLVKVPNREIETLEPIIKQYILPGSRIISDGYSAYSNIGEIGGGIYMHNVAVHESNYVDPNDPDINTQLIENLWLRMKTKLRQRCWTSEELFPSYLDELMWRQTIGNNVFGEMVCLIKENYSENNSSQENTDSQEIEIIEQKPQLDELIIKVSRKTPHPK